MKVTLGRNQVRSATFGFASAIIVALIGPLFGGLVLLLIFPLVFGKVNRVAPGWLAAAYVPSWFVLLGSGAAPAARTSMPEAWPMWLGIGLVPLLMYVTHFAAHRLRSP